MSPGRHWWQRVTARVLPVLAFVAIGIAVWFSCGRLIVIDQHADLTIRFLPPLWLLAVTILLGLTAGFWHSTPHRWLLILPAALLALPWLPYSALAERLPVRLSPPSSVFLWLGPVIPLVWATLLVTWLADLRIGRRAPGLMAMGTRLVQHPRCAPFFAICCAFVLFTGAAFRLAPWLPDGDEPHYLVIAQSLLHDGDLRIENNHAAGQYRDYTTRALKPDFLRRGRDGQIYSVHAPGLPALVLPAFAIAGYRGAQIFLALIAAIGTGLAWRLCWLVTARASAAWIGWAAVTGSSPFVFHAFTMYPDGVASVIVLTGVIALVRASAMTPARACLHGAALALLPWLHTRYAILATTLGVLIVWRLWLTPNAARARRVAAFLALPAGSAIAWFTFFQVIYGTIDPTAPYGSTSQISWSTLPNGVVGLLVDQQFGLITNAPIYAIALGGLIWMLMRSTRRSLALEIAIVAVPYALVTAAFPMWWGGWSAPARFLAPLVLTLSLPVAVVWHDARTLTSRATIGVALGITLWLTTLMLVIHRGRIVYNDRDGYALWADWAGPVIDLPMGLPSLFRGGWPQALACAMVWAVAIAIAWWVLRSIERRVSEQGRPLFMTAIAPAAFAVMAMVALAVNGAGWHTAHGASPFRPPAQQARQYGAGPIYALGEGISLEPGGFWIEAGAERLLYLPTPRHLALRNGELPNRVWIVVEGGQGVLTLPPRSETIVEMPDALVRMRVERGVRPSDLDPTSGDHRLLGLWVEVR